MAARRPCVERYTSRFVLENELVANAQTTRFRTTSRAAHLMEKSAENSAMSKRLFTRSFRQFSWILLADVQTLQAFCRRFSYFQKLFSGGTSPEWRHPSPSSPEGSNSDPFPLAYAENSSNASIALAAVTPWMRMPHRGVRTDPNSSGLRAAGEGYLNCSVEKHAAETAIAGNIALFRQEIPEKQGTPCRRNPTIRPTSRSHTG